MKLLLSLAVAISLLASAVAETPKRPNILIVMSDDQGYGDFSFTGNPVLKTPNLDKFAKESIRLTDFHVAPMCSPTRGQLLTGQCALRNGATSVTAGRTFMRVGIPTMPEILRKAGYRTGIFGKWHLGDHYPHRPMDRGFDESVYHLGWGMQNSTPEFDNPLIDGRYFHNGEPKQFKGHCTDFWFDSATAWIKERREKGEPFFCYLPTNAPHGPHVELERFSVPYQGKGPTAFFGMIAHVDYCFGKLERFLAENGLRDNTIVIFMTDNGGTSGVRVFNAGMRAGKTTYYDGGHRVPCWIRWPAGKLGSPRDIAVPAQNQDILPTLLDLSEVPLPAGAKLDGTSLAGLLRGTAKTLEKRTLVVQYGQIIKKNDACVIMDQWRLVHGKELYDIKTDPGQKNNLFDREPAVARALQLSYDAWWAGIEPLINDFVPISIGAAQQPVVELTSGDWEGIYADNTGHVRTAVGGPRGGHWHINVEQAGEYEFTLRRWPEQTKKALGDKYDAPGGGPMAASKAFPIAQAHLQIAGLGARTKTAPTEQAATVTLRVPAGKTTLKAWFQDESGNDLCGAFFVSAKKVK